jgi:hypothetical protein
MMSAQTGNQSRRACHPEQAGQTTETCREPGYASPLEAMKASGEQVCNVGNADKGKLQGGPQLLQLYLDGMRPFVTNSLLSSWDNQFYPEPAKTGAYIAN